MTPLLEIRETLRSDAGRRRRMRVVDGLLMCAVAIVATGFVYYGIDRRLGLYRSARLLLDIAFALPIVWIAWRRIVPWLRRSEDEIDVALRYQRRLGIDSDLVAALEFEAVGAGRRARGRTAADHASSAEAYGSPELREALLEQVGGMAPRIAGAAEPTDPKTIRRMQGMGLALVAAAVVIVIWQANFVAFVRRAALADVAYPSDTRIVSWTIDGREPQPRSSTWTDGSGSDDLEQTVTAAMGRPAAFELRVAGEIPDYATLELVSESGAATSLELASTEAERSVFRATLPSVVETLRGRFVAGDAFSEPFTMVASPLPLVTVTLVTDAPDYADGIELPVPPPGRLNWSVLEGSSVAVVVECANKALRGATLVIADRRTPLAPVDGTNKQWRADPAAAGLSDIRRQIDYTIEAEDVDGFRPGELKGSIGLRPDQAPTVASEVVTKWVLAKGSKPSIAYDAADDLGIQGLAVTREVVRADGSTSTDRVEVPLEGQAVRTRVSGKFAMPLDELQLAKGDKVTIRVEARDRRADAGRAVAQSAPHTLEVTDEQGLYEAMAETDRNSALKMEELISKQTILDGRGRNLTTGAKPASPTATPSTSAVPSSTIRPPASLPSPTAPNSPTSTSSPPGPAGPIAPAGSAVEPAPPAETRPASTVAPAAGPTSGSPRGTSAVTNPPVSTTPSGSKPSTPSVPSAGGGPGAKP